MRSKTILSVAAFIIAFVFSAAFASLFAAQSATLTEGVVVPNYTQSHTSCFKNRGNYTADKIEVLLKQDDRNGRTLDRKLFQIDKGYRSPFASSSFTRYAAGVSEYASESGSLNADGLPQEFQIVWQEYMEAWQDYADFLSEMRDDSVRGNLSSESLGKLDKAFNAEIERTWKEVLRVSDEYGANFR